MLFVRAHALRRLSIDDALGILSRDEDSYVDVWGAGLLIAALSAMQIALSRGERNEWFQSSFIVCFLIVAIICFLGFLWWDWRPENPSPVLHPRASWRYVPLRLADGRNGRGRNPGCGTIHYPSVSAARQPIVRDAAR